MHVSACDVIADACTSQAYVCMYCMHCPMMSQVDACSYCMGSVVLISSGIYLYLQLLWELLSLNHRNLLYIECSLGVSSHIWLLNQWCYNQVQKLVIHRYLLNCSLGLWGLILFSDFQTFLSPFKIKKNAQITHAFFWLLTLSSTFFNSNF